MNGSNGNWQNTEINGKLILGIIGGFFAITLLLSSFVTVDAGYRGVRKDWGEVTGVYTEGLYFKMPVKTNIVGMNVQKQKYTTSLNAATKETQNVFMDVALNYRVNPQKVGDLYKEVGLNYESVLIEPFVQDVVKRASSNYTAETYPTVIRNEAKEEMVKELERKLETDGYFEFIDFNIVNYKFSDQYENAIEAKQTAEQEALKAKEELKKIEISSRQRVVEAQANKEKKILDAQAKANETLIVRYAQAQGQLELARAEAEALRLQREQLSEDVLELRSIEAWKSGGAQVPQYILAGNGEYIWNMG